MDIRRLYPPRPLASRCFIQTSKPPNQSPRGRAYPPPIHPPRCSVRSDGIPGPSLTPPKCFKTNTVSTFVRLYQDVISTTCWRIRHRFDDILKCLMRHLHEDPTRVYRTTIGNLSRTDQTAIEYLSNIYPTSNEHLSNNYGTSKENLSNSY